MALRNILKKGEKTLEKKCRQVKDFDRRLHELLDDMGETLTMSNGVGLAAPQVGVLRRVVIVLETNVDEEAGQEPYLIELINPELIFREGEDAGPEGCLSVPGVFAFVARPEHVIVLSLIQNGETFEVEGFGLTARAFCHELDHLEGRLFLELADHIMSEEELEAYYAKDMVDELAADGDSEAGGETEGED